jgi:hypothetical protein
MPQDVYLYERLVVGLEGPVRREAGQDADRLRVMLTVKNPIGALGSTMRLPNMEVWDTNGRVYEVTNDDWAEPIEPDTEIRRPVEFEIAPDAVGLELVMGPGETAEVHIPMEDGA